MYLKRKIILKLDKTVMEVIKHRKKKLLYDLFFILYFIFLFICFNLFYSFIIIDTVALISDCPVGWGWRIHWLHLCRGVRPPPTPNECPRYDTKQSDGEVPVMLGLWVIRSTLSLPLLPGLLWSGVVAPDMALSMG